MNENQSLDPMVEGSEITNPPTLQWTTPELNILYISSTEVDRHGNERDPFS